MQTEAQHLQIAGAEDALLRADLALCPFLGLCCSLLSDEVLGWVDPTVYTTQYSLYSSGCCSTVKFLGVQIY